jgi:transposase
VRSEPEEIPDEDHEQLIERVCAIDVAKASGKVCTQVPHESGSGRRVSKVWDVAATTNAIIELGDHLVCQGVEIVTVESTSDYWRIFFYLLEARGLNVQLVNARDVKNVPGRPKTDLLTELLGEIPQFRGRVAESWYLQGAAVSSTLSATAVGVMPSPSAVV